MTTPEKLQKILSIKQQLNDILSQLGVSKEPALQELPEIVKHLQVTSVTCKKTAEFGFFVVDEEGYIGTKVDSDKEHVAAVVPNADFSQVGLGKVTFDRSHFVRIPVDTVQILNDEPSYVKISTDYHLNDITCECSDGLSCILRQTSPQEGWLSISGTSSGTVKIFLKDKANSVLTINVVRYEYEGITRRGWISTRPLSSEDLFFIDSEHLISADTNTRVVFTPGRQNVAFGVENSWRCGKSDDGSVRVFTPSSETVLAYEDLGTPVEFNSQSIPGIVKTKDTIPLFGNLVNGKVQDQMPLMKLHFYEHDNKRYVPVLKLESSDGDPMKDTFLLCLETGSALTWSKQGVGGVNISSGTVTPENDFLNA